MFSLMDSIKHVKIPKNDGDLIKLGWELAKGDVEPKMEPEDFERINMTADLSRNIIAAVNWDRRKDRWGHNLTDLTLVIVPLVAWWLGWWESPPSAKPISRIDDTAIIDDAAILAFLMLTVWRGADALRDRWQKKHRGRTTQHFTRLFKGEPEAPPPRRRWGLPAALRFRRLALA
ncbi:MAG: hypothetical protein HY053_03850 [Proteobacteria bacterium]|nr:hypothetical protein [Pseudomonadota bacterium]